VPGRKKRVRHWWTWVFKGDTNKRDVGGGKIVGLLALASRSSGEEHGRY